MTVTIYHNPACGTSRNVLGLIRDSGEEPVVIEYLKTPPTRAELVSLIDRMGISGARPAAPEGHAVRARSGSTIPALTDDQLIDAMMARSHPHQSSDRGDAAWCQALPAARIRARNPAHRAGRCLVSEAAVSRREVTKAPSMGVFERYLTLWVALCIVVGIVLGQAIPGVFRLLGEATVAQVNLLVAVLVWLMIVPMLLKIDLGALGQVREHWRGIAATVGVNWLIKPFSMALLVYLNAGLAYWLNRRLGVEWCVAGPSALIGASNFFELAVATAIALFGFQSGAALATVVGVLIEVPVMLSVVRIVRRSRGWYERALP